jgi:hypothetical protein
VATVAGVTQIENCGMCGLMLEAQQGVTTGDRVHSDWFSDSSGDCLCAESAKRAVPVGGGVLDRGDWRSIEPTWQRDFSDSFVTSWIIMSVRSGQNAGFQVLAE